MQSEEKGSIFVEKNCTGYGDVNEKRSNEKICLDPCRKDWDRGMNGADGG